MQEFTSRTLRAVSILLVLLTTLAGCNEIFEEDLSDDIVELVFPANNVTTVNQSVTFRWKPVAGATDYNLEVVEPSFFGVTSYTYDTTLTDNEITLTLYPGQYEWRVRASNFSSSTPYSHIHRIHIDTTSDLSVQVVTLTSPNNVASNNTSVDFMWGALAAAESYQLQIYSGSSFGGGVLLLDTNLVSNALSAYTMDEGEYSWGVKAMNSIPTETAYSTAYFELDASPPQTVTLDDPDGATFATDSIFTYSWTALADTGVYQSQLTDSVYVATDSTFSSIYTKLGTTAGSISDNIPLPDTYYWRVKTFDAAGNSSSYSDHKSFEVQ